VLERGELGDALERLGRLFGDLLARALERAGELLAQRRLVLVDLARHLEVRSSESCAVFGVEVNKPGSFSVLNRS